jgi:hypothetical protein
MTDQPSNQRRGVDETWVDGGWRELGATRTGIPDARAAPATVLADVEVVP